MKDDLPGWVARRLVLVPPLVPIVVGIGTEVGWWSPSVTLASLVDTLAIGVLALLLGRRVTTAEAETAMHQELGLIEMRERQDYIDEQQAWDTAVIRSLAPTSLRSIGQEPDH